MSAREALEDWCASYVAAFESYDASAIGRHWAFPAMILQGEKRLIFDSADRFNANTSMLLKFYQAQNVKRVVRRVVSVMEMGASAASMVVADEMRTADEQPIVNWQAAYVMQRIDGAYRAVAAAAEGEVSAWAARGTPLGRV